MSFRFKQFRVCHDRCAMKVGTDGVLLGAWGEVGGRSILDIGTGSGLIALMAAQRNPQASVLGLDIDETAVRQAQENMAESPFSERLRCLCADVLTYEPASLFDAILCNPPFFTEDTLPDDAARALARNNRSLPFRLLIPKVAAMLTDAGTFSVIVPSQLQTELVGLCLQEKLHLSRRCLVQTTANKPPRRTLMTFSRQAMPHSEERLVLTSADGSRSPEYTKLTDAFYL